MPEIGSIFADRYKLLQSLGHGGFADVFLAEDVQTAEKVVVKVPHSSQWEDKVVYERFRREMEIGRLLQHPDVPEALTLSEGKSPYLVMQYMEGEPLAKILKRQGRLPVNRATEIVANLLDTLQYCHHKGVYHRDLKPENLLLGPDGRLKLVDFGIALMEGAQRVTWRGFAGILGTPEYMAPEQIRGERGGAASDIYAVGCLLYQLLSGSPPFAGKDPLAVMHQHMTKSPEPLTSILPDLPPGIRAAIRRALRRRKQERYACAKDMAHDLRHPESAELKWLDEPDPTMVMATFPAKRNYLQITGITVLVVLLIVVFCVLMYEFRQFE